MMGNENVIEKFNTNIGENYSSIISPAEYNRIISEEHLYISESDRCIELFIKKQAERQQLETVELGCGPGRLLPRVAKIDNINLTAVDVDESFLCYAEAVITDLNLKVLLKKCSAVNYTHGQSVDIFYSQGFHHHIKKGSENLQYLVNIKNQLSDNGYYILGDEFIPNYNGESERRINLVIWYSHIIVNAIQSGFDFLAREEIKTMIDDLQEGLSNQKIKTYEQIELAITKVSEIEILSKTDILKVKDKAAELIDMLDKLFSSERQGDNSIDLSRHDYKISHQVLEEEISKAGLMVDFLNIFGPMNTVGGMAVYFIKKR